MRAVAEINKNRSSTTSNELQNMVFDYDCLPSTEYRSLLTDILDLSLTVLLLSSSKAFFVLKFKQQFVKYCFLLDRFCGD
jgi:hypothetical protein